MWLPPLALVLLTLFVFSRTLSFSFVWDDWLVLLTNPRMNPPTLASIAYYWTHPAWNLYMPLATTGWALLAALAYQPTAEATGHHLDPAVFHAANLLLQAWVAWNIYRLLLRIVQHRWPAAAGAALFALHPLQVEVVSFVGALNTLLCAGLAIPALCDFWDAAARAPSRPSRWRLARSSVLLLLATLCKPIAVVIPLFALVLQRLVLRQSWSTIARCMTPLLLAILPCLIWTKRIQPPLPLAAVAVPIWFRPVVAADTVAQYGRLLLAPVHLCVDYGRTPHWLFAHAWHSLDGLLTLALLMLAWTLRRRWPVVAAGLLLFVVGFLPVSGWVPFDFQQFSTIGDRYAYLPMLGPALVGAALLSTPIALRHRRSLTALSLLAVACCSVASFAQSAVWQDDQTLFAREVALHPSSWLGHENLAVALLRRSPTDAVRQAERAIALQPQNATAYETWAEALLASHDPQKAAQAARSGIAQEPGDAQLHRLLAIASDLAGNRPAAISAYERYLALHPGDAAAEINLAADYAEAGQLQQAAACYTRALQLDPGSRVAAAGLARLRAAHPRSAP